MGMGSAKKQLAMTKNENPFPPETGQQSSEFHETASFAMGCFWSVDALFGSLPGVIRTRVGYAGGNTPEPTYRQLGDHIETLQLDFDPSVVDYQHLADVFFQHHNPIGEPWKRQYMSAVFYHRPEQQRLAEQTIQREATARGRKIFTAVYPYQHFTLAEDRHQKYKLQRQPLLLAELQKRFSSFPELVHSTIAARVNGHLYGYGKRVELEKILDGFGISQEGRGILLEASKTQKTIG